MKRAKARERNAASGKGGWRVRWTQRWRAGAVLRAIVIVAWFLWGARDMPGAVAAPPVTPIAPKPSHANATAGPQRTGVATAAPVALVATHFAHVAHAQHGLDVAVCSRCHTLDANAAVNAPAARGHAPCLSAQCHATDFVASGPTTLARAPARWARAQAFCLGCHAPQGGRAPQPTAAARADAVFRGQRDYHVEMDHFAHAQAAPCRQCHIVDPTTFSLRPDAPGHRECLTCHDGKAAPAMAACGDCHKSPAPRAYFTQNRSDSDVRSCAPTTANAAASARAAHSDPCFTHERSEHRQYADGTPLSCGNCHFMLANRSVWGQRRYQSLFEIKANPIIENQRDRAHRACGTSGCHRADVSDAVGTARCGLCHTKRVLDSIFQ